MIFKTVETKFLVIKDKGLVVCEKTYALAFPTELTGVLRKVFKQEWEAPESTKRYLSYNTLIFTSKGRAKCTGSDVFDEKIGKKIASNKCNIKANNKVILATSRIVRELARCTHEVVAANVKAHTSYNDCYDRITEYYGDE